MTIQGYPLCLALRRAMRKGRWFPKLAWLRVGRVWRDGKLITEGVSL